MAPLAMSRLALPAVLLGALILSTSAIFVRLSEVGPLATGMYRMALALPLFWVMMAREGQRSDDQDRPVSKSGLPLERRDISLAILAGLFYAADLASWHISIGMTSVANAATMGNTAPVFVALASFVFFKEHLSRAFLAGLGLAMVGCVILVAGSFSVSTSTVIGDLLGILTAIFYAGYFLTVARIRKRVSTAAIMAISGLTCTLVLAPIAWIIGEQFIPVTALGWVWLFGLAYVCQLGGQTLIINALAYLPASFGAVALLVQPVGTAVIGWFVLAEAVTLDKAIGIAAILAGIWLARKGTPSGEPATPTVPPDKPNTKPL